MAEHVRAQGRTPAGSHVPVLLDECLEALDVQPGRVMVDATLGHGGHAQALAERLGPTGRLIALDQDGDELARTRARLQAVRPGAPIECYHMTFAGIGKVMAEVAPEGFDGILADLGLSSMQIDDPARGFSYKNEGPLDMRMDRRRPETAATLLGRIDEAELAELLERLGNEPKAARIARRLVHARDERPITTTWDIVRLVFEAKKLTFEEWKETVREHPSTLHPAARTFQALRMAVNDEVGQLEQFLRLAPWCLKPGGRIAVIAFHSGEDGRVAAAFREGFASGLYEEISAESIRPSPAERRANPRSASARLRVARRTAAE
jgi:16S rRNA (cytosine1402-N4)-methyltransferase